MVVSSVRFVVQAEDGIRALVRSGGLGDVYKRQTANWEAVDDLLITADVRTQTPRIFEDSFFAMFLDCLLYTSDAADERSSVDLGGRRIINKKTLVRCAVSGEPFITHRVVRD